MPERPDLWTVGAAFWILAMLALGVIVRVS